MDVYRVLTEAFRAEECPGTVGRISGGERGESEAVIDPMRALQELARRELFEVPNEQWRRDIDDLARHVTSVSDPTHPIPQS